MGFELTSFVNEIEPEFVCPICMTVVQHPLVSPCEHIFCNTCIVNWLIQEQICPVDRKKLRIVDLKAVPRYYRNLWSRLKVRCEMEHLGCTTVVSLENLETHRTNCTFKPDTIVVCDKGCNLSMTRLEYQKNCISHLAKKYGSQLDEMKSQIDILTGQIKRQRDVMVRLISKSNYPPKLAWKQSYNMKMSSIDPNVFDLMNTDSFCWAFVQYSNLDVSNFNFKIRVLSLADGEYVVIGLTQNDYNYDELPGRLVGSIGYYSRGEVLSNAKADMGLKKWEIDDVIECGVVFQNSSLNDQFEFGEVYFSINQHVIAKKKMKIPTNGLFPVIRIGSFTTSVPRIEYLSN